MKNILFIIFCLPTFLLAQAPQGFTYQGVATNNEGIELSNQEIAIRASVIAEAANGSLVYEETHLTTTDAFGLFNVVIGSGQAESDFSTIDWGSSAHFLKIELDINGGSEYIHIGTQQMMSVPYALYAENTNNNLVINQFDNNNFPEFYYNTGLCSDDVPSSFKIISNFSSIGDTSLGNGIHDFCNFRLNYGHTLEIYGNVIIRVKDTLVINGNIDGSGKGGESSDYSSGGGNGGSCTSDSWWHHYNCTNNGATCDGCNASFDLDFFLNKNTSLSGRKGKYGKVVYHQSTGQSISGNDCEEETNGGSGLIIVCKHLIFNGLIDLSGNDAITNPYTNSQVNRAGNGGGGAGSIIINAYDVISNTGNIIVNGGLGGPSGNETTNLNGTSCTDGNNGGNGFILWLGDE